MDAQYERRLLFSINGQSSLSACQSPVQSPIKSSDRYIPLRSSLSASNLQFHLNTSSSSSPTNSPQKKSDNELNPIGLGDGISGNKTDLIVYQQLLQNTLLDTNVDTLPMKSDCFTTKTVDDGESSIFRYSERRHLGENLRTNSINNEHWTRSPISSASLQLLYSPKKSVRHIAELPFKVLDAPDLQDDFYLNLIDWSSTNLLSVGLSSSVYIYNAQSNQVQLLTDLSQTLLSSSSHYHPMSLIGSDLVTSVQWAETANLLAVGTHRGYVHLYDVTTRKRLQTMNKHSNRVGVMAWNEWSLCSGSRDRSIIEHDIRQKSIVQTFRAHTQEVCGLKWSPDRTVLASGGNDNHLNLWSRTRASRPIHSFTDHLAAVKAIAWSPHQHGLVASGGGSADRHIRFRSSLTCQTLSSFDTGSQVCQLVWSKNSANEFVSTHGFVHNQVIVWKYPSMQPLAKLSGHKQRVLYLAISPDGEAIVTGAGDETLRFWNVFPRGRPTIPSESKFNGLRQMR